MQDRILGDDVEHPMDVTEYFRCRDCGAHRLEDEGWKCDKGRGVLLSFSALASPACGDFYECGGHQAKLMVGVDPALPDGAVVMGTTDDGGGGRKDDTGKPRYDLLPALALDELAQLFANGANKYGDRNWEAGMGFGRMFAAMMRHAWKWWRGEEDDPENKVHHLTSVAWYALCLLEFIRTGRGKDDRSDMYRKKGDDDGKHLPGWLNTQQ